MGLISSSVYEKAINSFPSALAVFEILLKIHKPNIASRPIARLFNSPCSLLYIILNTELGEIWRAYKSKFKSRVISIRDSLEAVHFLENLTAPVLREFARL